MSERLLETNKKLFVCYIDYNKAFDKIKHVALSKMCAEYNVPNEDVRLTSNIYDYQKAQIRINTSLSRQVKISKVSDKDVFYHESYSIFIVRRY